MAHRSAVSAPSDAAGAYAKTMTTVAANADLARHRCHCSSQVFSFSTNCRVGCFLFFFLKKEKRKKKKKIQQQSIEFTTVGSVWFSALLSGPLGSRGNGFEAEMHHVSGKSKEKNNTTI